jgi:Omp85 superfamily domain
MRVNVSVVLVAISIWLASPLSAQDVCSAGDGANASVLCVSLRLDNGRLATERTRTTLAPSSQFARRSRVPVEHVRPQILNEFDKLLATFPPLVWFGLSTDERSKEAEGQLLDPRTRELRTFTGPWADFLVKYRAWQSLNRERQGEGPLFSSFFSSAQEERPNVDWGPLTPEDQSEEPGALDAAQGTARLRVADPIGPWASPEYEIRLASTFQDRVSIDDIITILSPLQGTLWRPALIRERISDILFRRGFNPLVEVSPARTPVKRITIRPAERIARFVFQPPANDTVDLDRALYLLLPSPLFRTFLTRKDTALVSLPGPPAIQRVDLDSLGVRAGDEPILNTATLQIQKLELGVLGFALNAVRSAPRPGSEDPYVDLRIQKQSSADSADETRSAPLPRTSISPNVIRPEPDGTDVAPLPRSALPTAEASPPPKDRKNYVAAGFEYRPGQGVRPIGLFQRSRPLGPGGLSLQAGGNNDKPIGSANLFLDFVGFPTFRRRLSIQATYASDYALRRQFGDQQADERRTGGVGRAELELTRGRGGRLAKLLIEGRRTSVELSNGVNDRTDLTTIEVGGMFFVDLLERAYPYRVKLEPFVRIGMSGESFTRLGMRGNYHQSTLGPVEFDLSGSLGWTSSQTPLVEWLSFGGAEGVRGFRQDDVVARGVWSVQPEVWVPLPGAGNATAGPGLWLHRSVRLAFFSDVGGARNTLGAFAGSKAGLGAGVRMTSGPAVLKLDWARPFGTAATDARGGRVYFSVSTTAPF